MASAPLGRLRKVQETANNAAHSRERMDTDTRQVLEVKLKTRYA
jgi:hypothetical protein